MPSDSESRRSAAGGVPPTGPGVTPDSSKDANWRRQVAGTYTFGSGGTAPTITTSATLNVNENATNVVTVEATGDPTITFSIVGGDDQALFSIDTNTGALTFDTPPNYESPSDANTDNDYLLTVRATNSSGSDDLAMTITVVDVVEGGGGTPGSGIRVAIGVG